MCIKKYIEGIVMRYMNNHPHPVEDHTHENYVEKSDIGYLYFANSPGIKWSTEVDGCSTTINAVVNLSLKV